jgi:phosphomannomutase
MGTWLLKRNASLPSDSRVKVVLGRDARISGKMISSLVANTLVGLGIDVLDLGLSTTPTVEVAVPMESAHGGIHHYGLPQSKTMECAQIIERIW